MDCYNIYICGVQNGSNRKMIIKIFKVSTKEMWTFKNKDELKRYVIQNVLCIPRHNATIDELIKYLPVEDYCRVK